MRWDLLLLQSEETYTPNSLSAHMALIDELSLFPFKRNGLFLSIIFHGPMYSMLGQFGETSVTGLVSFVPRTKYSSASK
jgi:hypothetical protein